MKRARPLIFIFVGFMLSLPSQAQNDNLSSIEVISSAGVFESAFMIRPEGRYKKVHGSPYLNEAWLSGLIWLDGDTVAGKYLMRYNVYGNEMQFIHKQDTFAVSNPLLIDRIQRGNQVFEYLPFIHRDNQSIAYFEVLEEGFFRLLVRHRVRLLRGKEPVTPYHSQNQYDRFVTGSTYYIQHHGDAIPVEVPKKKADWIKLAGLNGGKFKSFLHSEKIRLQKKDDIIKTLKYLNELEGS